MNDELIAQFDKILDCHKDFLIADAKGGDELMWFEMCSLYGFSGHESTLKTYILSRY